MLWRERLLAPLFRLFRFSSFIWGLRGAQDKEGEYLKQLKDVDLKQLQNAEGKTLRLEIEYVERRLEREGATGPTTSSLSAGISNRAS